MQVLFLTNIPAPYRVEFFNELGRFAVVTVLFERQSGRDRSAEWHGRWWRNFRGVVMPGLRVGPEMAFCPAVVRYLNRYRRSIIVAGGYATATQMFAIMYMRLRKIPFVLNADGAFIRQEASVKRSVKRLLIQSAGWWICSGPYTLETLVHYGADRMRVHLYPFTSLRESEILQRPPTREEQRQIRTELGMKGQRIVLSVGSYVRRKGFDTLIKAASVLPEGCVVYLVGGAPTKEYIRLVRRYGLEGRVCFVGFKSKSELRRYYMAADVFVLPTREDIWGLVVNEAMAHGLPVITTQRCIAGIELLGGIQSEQIVNTDDPASLASAIRILLENEEWAKEIGERNLRKIRGYTIESMALEHVRIFERILAGDPRHVGGSRCAEQT